MKFKLVENILTEAYDESMPEAIRSWIQNNRMYKNSLINVHHIDLSKAKFVEYPKPSTNRDPIFKDQSKMVFFVLPKPRYYGSQPSGYNIYAKGVNDDQQFYTDNNGNWISNKYLSAKKLMNDCTAIYFIDLTNPDNITLNKKKERAAYGLERDPNRRYDTKDIRDNAWSYSRIQGDKRDKYGIRKTLPSDVPDQRKFYQNVDKSGYYVDPKKYEKKMIELGMFDYAKKLDKAFNELMDAKKLIFSSMDNIDEKDLVGNSDILRAFSNSVGSIRQALDNYRSLEHNLQNDDRWLEQGQMSKEDYARNVRSELDNYLPSIQRRLKDAKDYFNDYISAVIDWDTDDYIDDED